MLHYHHCVSVFVFFHYHSLVFPIKMHAEVNRYKDWALQAVLEGCHINFQLFRQSRIDTGDQL